MISYTKVSVTIFLLIIFCFFNSAFAIKASRIELKDGKVYENVTFTIDNQYKVINIKSGDWKREVSFTDIARIYDEDGNDVSAGYLGNDYVPVDESKKDSPLSTERSLYKGYRKRPFNFWVTVSTDYSIPGGSYFNSIPPGIGFDIDIIVPVSKNGAIRGTIAKLGMGYDLKSLYPEYIIVDDNLSHNVWRFSISGQYYNWLKWRKDSRRGHYAYAGFGMMSRKLSGIAILQNPKSGERSVIIGTGKTGWSFVITCGGGLIFLVSSKVAMEIGVSFDLLPFIETSYSYSNYLFGTYRPYAGVLYLKVGLVGLF